MQYQSNFTMPHTQIIIDYFCQIRGISKEELICKQGKDICYSRFILWYYLHYEKNVPTSTIAGIFNRHRRNVFYGMSKLKHQMKYHKEIYMLYQSLKKELEGMPEPTSLQHKDMKEKD